MAHPVTVVVLSKFQSVFQDFQQSIRKLERVREVILVRDGDEVEAPSDWTVIQGPPEFSMAGNGNLGLRAVSSDSDVLYCGDDVRFLNEKTLEILQQVAYSDEKIGILSPKIIGRGSPSQVNVSGMVEFTVPTLMWFPCVYIKRELIEKIGYLDEQFNKFGSDDLDYCVRTLRAGYKLAVTNAVSVEHEGESGGPTTFMRAIGQEAIAKQATQAVEKLCNKYGVSRERYLQFYRSGDIRFLESPVVDGVSVTVGPNRKPKNLVIVRAGDNSLHQNWLRGSETRDWDILVSYFGDSPDRYRDQNIARYDSKGPKWPALHDLVHQKAAEILQYDYIWFPDDDLEADAQTINRMFAFCAELNLDLGQPALTADSYISHAITLANKSFLVRYTNFVEIMAPVFSRDFLQRCAPSFNENASGWGLDFVWPSWTVPSHRVGILDICSIRHTRPVGGPNYQAVAAAGGNSPQEEKLALLAKHGLPESTPQILGGIDRNGQLLTISDGKGAPLIEAIVAGYLPELANCSQALLDLVRPILQSMTGPKRIDINGIQQLVSHGNAAEAIRLMDAELARNETAEMWNDWGAIHFATGNQSYAEQGFRQALKVEPLHRQAAINLAALLLTQGRTQEAEPVLVPHVHSLTAEERQAMISATNDSSNILQAEGADEARRNLVVVMAGDHSLHCEYAVQPRDFELCVVYYGDRPEIAEKYRNSADYLFVAKGLKIELVRKLFLEQMLLTKSVDFSRYKFILMPDDDIRFPAGAASISAIFQTAEAIRADVFQPAVLNENYSVAWEATRVIPGAFCHRVNIVETMMHGFSGEAFSKAYLPAIHAMEFMKSGWGIEPITMKIGEAIFKRSLRTFVLDQNGAIHTRPVGGNGDVHGIGRYEAQFVPQIETNRMRTLRTYTSLQEVLSEPDYLAPSDTVDCVTTASACQSSRNARVQSANDTDAVARGRTFEASRGAFL